MKIRKKLLWYLAVIWLWFAAFAPSTIIWNTAYAQEATTQNETPKPKTIEESLKGVWDFVDLWLRLIYVVIWPMLFLAWIALDNTMVYWSVFHMDAPLRYFWNMTKNFANFALWFIVLFSILKGIFSSFWWDKWKDARSPMTVIKNTLIAWVLIQASWFLTAALIDVSTVATYAIGGMPTSLLIKEKDQSSFKLLPTHSKLDLNNANKKNWDDIMTWYKAKLGWENEGTTINISPCLIKQFWANSYIVWRKYWWEMFNHTTKAFIEDPSKKSTETNSQRNICIFGDTVYFFNEFPNAIKDEKNYETTLLNNINVWSWAAAEFAKCGFFIDIWDEKKENINMSDCSENTIKNSLWDDLYGLIFSGAFPEDDLKKGKVWADYNQNHDDSWIKKTAAPTVESIIEKTKWFMWPLATIYISIMDFAHLTDTSTNASVAKNVWDLLIRLWVAIGMVFPLIALAVVLFIRIWFLRVVIAASPLLILANVFKDTIKMDEILKNFSISNILKAMFAPVITVFALSISLIFMTTLSNSLSTNNIEQANILWHFDGKIESWPDKEFNYISFFWYTVAYPKIAATYAWATWDWFSWMIISFCGIGIMWFLLFAAIKASGTIWKVWDSIKNFWENVIKTTPIVPMAGGVGIWSLKEQLIDGNFAEQYRNKNVVKYDQQQANMNDYVETRFPNLKQLGQSGLDNDFNKEELQTTNKLLNDWNTNWAINYLKEKRFIKNEAWKEKESMIDLYNRSPEFQKMIDEHKDKETLSEWLFWNRDFIKQKKEEKKQELIESLGKKIEKTYDNKNDLDKAISEIDSEDLDIWDKIKEGVKVWDDTYKIEKSENGLVATKTTQ